jgi:phage regulator Rha-like protein
LKRWDKMEERRGKEKEERRNKKETNQSPK